MLNKSSIVGVPENQMEKVKTLAQNCKALQELVQNMNMDTN